MQLGVYDKDFLQIDNIDSFSSLIWTKRYRETGDFEIKIPLENEKDIPGWAKCDNYISLREDVEEGYYMIIDRVEVSVDEEDGNILTISGKSLDVILNRRIVWEQTSYTNKTSDVISHLLRSAIIEPSLEARRIKNFVFQSPPSAYVFSTVNTQYTGDNLLTAIRGLADIDDYGISVLYDDNKGQFICELYKGTDRSFDQSNSNAVLFSTDLGNLISSNYLESTEDYRNVVLAMGQGTGSSRTRYILGDVSGLDRREYYKDARDVSTSNALEQRANEALKEHRIQELLDGEVTSDIYQYGTDYFVGDIVQIRNSLGIERKARVIEVIFSQDSSGETIYPTVEVINEEE